MSIGIEHVSQSSTHGEYEVTFFNDVILTTVTHTPWVVDDWISTIEYIHRRRLHRLVVGLDIEWRPNFGGYLNPVATLQLCVGRRCLIFKLIYADYIPYSLVNFLGDKNITFVGVGVDNDAEKLLNDYDLEVQNAMDLSVLARNQWGMDLRFWGLKDLARQVLNVEFYKPKNVTLSRWDYSHLTHEQVQYACIDAFVSFEIGRILKTRNY